MNSRAFIRAHFYSVAAATVVGLLGLASPANASTFQLCPNAASDQNGAGTFTFTDVAGPLDGTCGVNSAVKMDIPKETDYARLAWHSTDAGYPAGLTLGNLAGLSADVGAFSGQAGDQPYYLLAFTDATDGLGQTSATDQILMIEFQPSTISGSTIATDPSATLFNLYDNTAGFYLGTGQSDTNTIAGWLSADPFLGSESLQQIRIGIGLAGGGTNPESLTLNSLTVTMTDASVPEPTTLVLLGTGLVAVLARRRIRSRA